MLCAACQAHTDANTVCKCFVVVVNPVSQVQRSIGRSDYVRRDVALKNLIQPLAGEYGMHNDQPQREWGNQTWKACCVWL